MFKMLVFLCLFSSPALHTPSIAKAPADSCPAATGLQKGDQNYNSYSVSWNSAYTGALYKVWYVRQEGGLFSGYFYTNSTSYNFTLAGAGHYTFYCRTVCEGESSSYIGIEDVISA